MRDEVPDMGEEQTPEQPTAKRVAVGAAASLVVVLVLWGAAHVMIPPVRPGAAAPKGHSSAPCWACHIVSEGAPSGEGG